MSFGMIAASYTASTALPAARMVGAPALGSTSYTIPAGAVYVSTTGNDANPGTLAAPFATIAAASQAVKATGTAQAPATVVIRGGVYHEPETYAPGNGYYLRWQAYPGETVWLDGSSIQSSWTPAGSTWVAPYTTGWEIPSLGVDVLNGDPYAHYPDQVWLDGVALAQIADGATPGAGEFSVDRTAETITIGSSPVGKQARICDRNVLTFSGSRIDILGIGVRRYAACLSQSSNCVLYYGGASAGTIIEACVFEDIGRSVLSLTKTDMKVRECSFSNVNQVAIGGTRCDRLTIERCLILDTNQGLWKTQPQTGPIKITVARGVTICHNRIERSPRGNMIWFDVSCTQVQIYGNWIDGGASESVDRTPSTGICYEGCDGGYWDGVQYYSHITGNNVLNCGAGIVAGASGYVKITNNTIQMKAGTTGTARGIVAVQDRDDNRGEQISPTICHWWTRNIVVVNNRFRHSGVGIQLMAYDSQNEVDRPRSQAIATGLGDTDLAQVIGGHMLEEVSGNWFSTATGLELSGSIMTSLSRAIGGRLNTQTPAGLTVTNAEYGYGSPPFGTNYQSATDPAGSDHATATPLGDWASLIDLSAGAKYVGSPIPEPIARPLP